MATLIVTHRVSNYDSWKSVYDAHTGARKEAGITAAKVHRDHADPNLVTIVMSAPTVDTAKAFAGSPDLKQAMQKAGIDGPPEIRFLDDVESTTY